MKTFKNGSVTIEMNQKTVTIIIVTYGSLTIKNEQKFKSIKEANKAFLNFVKFWLN